MGKIVKYCAACEESFAEKFGFCPNCGQEMTAFEMSPVTNQPTVFDAATASAITDEPTVQAPAPEFFEQAPAPETLETATEPVEAAANTVAFLASPTQTFSNNDLEAEKPVEEPATIDESAQTKTFAAGASSGNFNQTAHYNFQDISDIKPVQNNDDDGGYHITVVEETNGKQRNTLFLGATALMLLLVLGSTVFSLFNKDLMIGAIGEESGIFVPVVEDVPMEVEEQPKPKTDKDAGGGGGGGREEQEEPSKGRLVSQSQNPITPPNARTVQITNPTIPLTFETKGNIKRPVTEERPGLPGSDNLNPSNGRGSGGGLGNGNGTGLGNGNGTGEGNGNGSGSGNGNGNGTGNGNQGNVPPPPPTAPVGVSAGVKIVSKPRANYTDAARQNQVQGTVTLRVTFTASGAIGSISPVSGLPYGLTEQAIAAARGIKFEPAKKNGVAQTVTKQVQYSFTIY